MQLYKELFIRKEFKSILGRHYMNYWILLVVFIITLFAIAFSRSGLRYLEFKMNDPFINWVQIKNYRSGFADNVDNRKEEFGISVIEENAHIFEFVFNSKQEKVPVEGRSIAFDSKLLSRILDKDNVINASSVSLGRNDIGWIVTEDLMKKLGYEEASDYPLFVDYALIGDSSNIKAWGIQNSSNSVHVPIPIVAVVRQLPDLLDFITPTMFEINNTRGIENPFNISMHKKYYEDLYIVANADAADILSELKEAGLQADDDVATEDFESGIYFAEKHRFVIRDTVPATINSMVEKVLARHKDWYRYYDYDIKNCDQVNKNYLSLMFTDLSKVPTFAEWAKVYHVRIDMAQIEAKKNFEVFSNLATTLCWLIAVIAIGFVVIFVYFLVDSHFRRISKNLGTIMAFGLSNTDIVGIYLPVFMGLIASSLISASAMIGVAEVACNALHLVRDGGVSYFAIEDAFVIVFVTALVAISAIMTSMFLRHKLQATPGDLIFERNN